MMQVPKLIPISEFRNDQTEIVDGLIDGPVVLARQGKAAAVLVHPDQWNALLRRLEELEAGRDGE